MTIIQDFAINNNRQLLVTKMTLTELHIEWKSLQPLKDEDQLRLNRKFMLEFNYNSK